MTRSAGIIYRAYEERALMIDNALQGVKVGYSFNDNWHVKAFTGRQKQQFDLYGTIVRVAHWRALSSLTPHAT
jgi:hypothetical protein